MALTVNDIARNLNYSEGDYDENELQDLLDSSVQIVKDYIGAKYDAENKAQQRAIKLLCGYYDHHKNLEAEMQSNGCFLPDPVRTILMPYYMPLCI